MTTKPIHYTDPTHENFVLFMFCCYFHSGWQTLTYDPPRRNSNLNDGREDPSPTGETYLYRQRMKFKLYKPSPVGEGGTKCRMRRPKFAQMKKPHLAWACGLSCHPEWSVAESKDLCWILRQAQNDRLECGCTSYRNPILHDGRRATIQSIVIAPTGEADFLRQTALRCRP